MYCDIEFPRAQKYQNSSNSAANHCQYYPYHVWWRWTNCKYLSHLKRCAILNALLCTNGSVSITRWHGCSVLRTTTQDTRENSTPAPQNPLKRWSLFAWVIMSETLTPMQNFITIRSGYLLRPFASARAYKVTRLVIFWKWVFFFSTEVFLFSSCTDFYDEYVKRRRVAQRCAFWGSRNKILHLRLQFYPKTGR